MCSSNRYAYSETWSSDDVSIVQWNSFRRRTYQRANETLSGGPSLFHDIPSPDEWLGGEEKLEAGVYAEGILFQVHDRLGQVTSKGDGSLQQDATFHHWG